MLVYSWPGIHTVDARIQKVLSEGVQIWWGFLFLYIHFFSSWGDRGSKYHYQWAIIGPPAKLHLNGVSLAGRRWPNIECWRQGSFVIFQGTRTSIAKKHYIFVIFQGGSGPPAPPPPTSGSAHAVDFKSILIDFWSIGKSCSVFYAIEWFTFIDMRTILLEKVFKSREA